VNKPINQPGAQALAAPGDLAADLAAWIDAEKITGNYDPAGIAARVAAQVHHSYLTAWLNQGGTAYLRDMCARIKDSADLTDAEHAAEMRGAA